MKALYIECNMGISGDMLMSALWGLVENKEKALEKINSINLPHTSISFESKKESGIVGYKANVLVDGIEEGEHQHFSRSLDDINSILDGLNVNQNVLDNTKELYKILAKAESEVHGENIKHIHFHEVGSLDAIADFTACSILFDEIGADIVLSSEINVGNGNVKCAHGVLPVPAPATAVLLNGIPYYKSDVHCELCTPTGASLVKKYCSGFGNMPSMTVSKVSYGFGKKTIPGYCNCVRLFMGELSEDNNACEFSCNVDDMTAEEISFASSVLIQNGALDVNVQNCVMKKNRAGFIINVLCSVTDKDKFINLLFKHTSTIGIREKFCSRYMLDRKILNIDTDYGSVRVKKSDGYGCERLKIEYDDVAKIASENDLTFADARKIIEKML